MIIQTDNHLGKWFTSNGTDRGQLVGTAYCTNTGKKSVFLAFKGGTVMESMDVFKSTYEQTQAYIPKGTICECIVSDHISLRYADGEGNLCLYKDLTIPTPERMFKSIKPLNIIK